MNLEYVDEFIHNLIVVSVGVLGSLFLISIYADCLFATLDFSKFLVVLVFWGMLFYFVVAVIMLSILALYKFYKLARVN